MECPKCGQKMLMTNTYKVPQGRTQRWACQNLKCLCVATAQTVIVAIDPKYGEGAYVLAKKMRENKKGLDRVEAP